MRRFLVWAAVLATALLVSATDTTVAKPIERKKDTKQPRDWMLAGDLAGDEEIAEQHQSGGYLRGSETAAPLAYTDKTSVSTTEKASASYTAKTNPPSSALYGDKVAEGATTATTTSTGAVKQGVGVSSVVAPWGSVTAKTPAYSNTKAPTPALERTGTTGGGLFGASVKVDNPAAPTIDEKTTAEYNAKTEESPPSASYGEKTAAPLATLPPSTAPSREKASTSPYSATDALKQGGVVSNVVVPWGTVNSNTPSYSTTKGPAPTERIEENGGGGAYDMRVKEVHDAIPVTDNKGGAKESDSNVHESPVENKASDSKFDLPQAPSTTSVTVEKTAPSIGPDATSTSNDYTSAPLSGIASATPYSGAKGVAVAMKTPDYRAADAPTSTTNYGGGAENGNHESITDTRGPITGNRGSARSDSWVTWQAPTDKRGGSTPTQKADPLYSVKPSSQYDHEVAPPFEDKAALPDTSDVDPRDDEKAWPRASEASSVSYNAKTREAANSAPYVSPSGDKHRDVASDVEDRKHRVGVDGSTPDIDKSKEVWGHDSVQPRSSDDDKTGQLREYVPPPGQSNEEVHPRHSSGRSFQRDEEGATTYSETNISTKTDGGEASYPTNNAGSEHPSLSDHGKIIYQDDAKQTLDTSATKHGADNENYGSKSGFDSAVPTPRWSKHGEDREDGKKNGNENDGNYANSAEGPGQEKRNAWAKSTGGDSGFHGDTAQTPSESTTTYGSEVDAPAGGKTKPSYASPAEHNGRGEEEHSSFRDKSSSSEGGGKRGGRVEELTVPWRQEAPSSSGYSSNPAPTSEVKKQSDETGYDAAKETTNSEPAHDSPVSWNDGKPQLVIDTAKAKLTPSPDHAEAEASPEEQTESRDYGHLFDDLVPWKASHSRLRRELQAEDNEQPAEQPAAEETHDKPQEVPADKPADDNTVVDQPGEEKSAEQQEDTSTEQPADQPTDTPTEQQEDTSAEQPADQPTETSAEQPPEHAETAEANEVMKTTAVVDENVRWNQDDCNPCDVPTQPPTSAPLYPRKDDDYEQQLPNVTDEYKSWDHVKEPASTPKKKKAYKPPKADLIRCTRVIGEYGESYECENEATQPPPPDTPYESTPSPEPPTEPPQETPVPTATEPPQETPAPATTEPPTEAPYEPTSTPQPSEPATTSPPTENTPAPTEPSEPTPTPSKPSEPTPAPSKPSEPSEPTPAPSMPSEPTPSPTKPGEATPAPTKAYDDSKSTPVSTSKGTSTFPTGTRATTSKTATPAATTAGPSTPAATSVDTSTGHTAYGTSGTTGGSNEKVVGASTSEGNNSSGSSDPLSGGAIAGIVIACVVFAAVVVGAVLYRQRSIARQREENLFADLAAGGAGRALETDYAAM